MGEGVLPVAVDFGEPYKAYFSLHKFFGYRHDINYYKGSDDTR